MLTNGDTAGRNILRPQRAAWDSTTSRIRQLRARGDTHPPGYRSFPGVSNCWPAIERPPSGGQSS